MESLDNPSQDLQELSFRVSKLRVSLRMKRRRSTVSTASTDSSSTTETASSVDNSRLQVPVGPDSAGSSVLSSSSFRSRLSSHSSVCSTDSGFLSARSRSRVGSSSSATGGTPVGCQSRPRLGSASSTASSSSRTSGSILHRIAKSHGEKATKNADSEFSMVYYRPRSSTFTSSTTSRGVARSVSNASSVSISSTGSRNRSLSVSSATADYAEVYSMVDPFDEEEDETAAIPPPLPPRCARLRAPALPPYPSSAVTLVQNISESILC